MKTRLGMYSPPKKKPKTIRTFSSQHPWLARFAHFIPNKDTIITSKCITNSPKLILYIEDIPKQTTKFSPLGQSKIYWNNVKTCGTIYEKNTLKSAIIILINMNPILGKSFVLIRQQSPQQQQHIFCSVRLDLF